MDQLTNYDSKRTKTKKGKRNQAKEKSSKYSIVILEELEAKSLQTTVNEIKPDLIILVETQLVGKNTIKIAGYDKIITRNRPSKGGGSLIAMKNTLDAKIVVLDINQNHEHMWVQLCGQKGKINLCVAYGLHETRCSKNEIENWHYDLEEKYAQFDSEHSMLTWEMTIKELGATLVESIKTVNTCGTS